MQSFLSRVRQIRGKRPGDGSLLQKFLGCSLQSSSQLLGDMLLLEIGFEEVLE